MNLEMLAVSARFALSALVVSTLVLACKSEEPAQQGGYPPQGQPAGYGQPPAQPGYAQPGTAPAPTVAQPAPVTPAPVTPAPAAAPLSAPGPLALPCTSDANCATHHCNTQFGKCAYPCQTDADCIQGSTCFAAAGALATCIPKTQ